MLNPEPSHQSHDLSGPNIPGVFDRTAKSTPLSAQCISVTGNNIRYLATTLSIEVWNIIVDFMVDSLTL